MEIRIEANSTIKEVPHTAFNVAEVNKIKHLKGGAVRQDSKAPTFSFDLRWHLPRHDEQPGLA